MSFLGKFVAQMILLHNHIAASRDVSDKYLRLQPFVASNLQLRNVRYNHPVYICLSMNSSLEPNHFVIPFGGQGKHFVNKLVELLNAFVTESPLESFAITAAMTMPALLLQKPHARSKTQDHINKELLREGRIIQAHLSK